MNSGLRHIALTVERNDEGAYLWLLIESAGDRLFVLERAGEPSPTYMRALTAGFEQLAFLSASGLHQRSADDNAEQREAFPRQKLESTG